MTDYFELGRVLKPQGIRGEIKIEAYTDDMNRFADLPHVYLEAGGQYAKTFVEKARTDYKAAYLKLEGIDDRDAAEALRGRYLYIDRENAAPLPEGAYYIKDLIGLDVIAGGEKLGILKDILQPGAADVYVVTLNGGGTCMFPSVPGVFVEKDVAGGRLVVDENRLKEVAVYDV